MLTPISASIEVPYFFFVYLIMHLCSHHFVCTLQVKMQQSIRILYMLSVDPALGRLDASLLSDQALMEMLFEGMQDSFVKKSDFQDESGNFLDACEWQISEENRVQCTDERVTDILFSALSFNKTQFPFRFIPPLMQRFTLVYADLHGTLDTSVLPQNLIDFGVLDSSLHGTINFSNFPRKLQFIHVEENKFTGSCDLYNLPDALVELQASENEFIGEISLDNLPRSMKLLDLSGNYLTGSITISRLPKAMQEVLLQNNEFTGEFRLMSITPNLLEINICDNPLRDTIVIRRAKKRMRFILQSDCASVNDEKGHIHAWETEILTTNY